MKGFVTMKDELVKKLHDEYPIIFRPDDQGFRTVPSILDGWWILLDKLCYDLEKQAEAQGKRCTCGHSLEEHADGACSKSFLLEIEKTCYCQGFADGRMRITQVKEKFGSLRVYTDYPFAGVHERLIKAEDDSLFICESCGNGGKRAAISSKRQWIKTLCDPCRIELAKSF